MVPPDPTASPLILDLDGDGVETTSIADGVHFDHDGNRFSERTAWAGSDDAMLVWDRNGNGQIDDGGELFGNNFLLSNGQKAQHGFEALKEFDTNGDRIVDAKDERWSELRLWQDRNGNGVVDDGELLSMEEAGVAGLHVNHQNPGAANTDEHGNEHRQTGTFIREDGTTGQMADVWFKTDLIDTIFKDAIDITDEAIKGLPNLRGYGNVPSLHQAMALDETGKLQELLQAFVDADPADAPALVWDIMLAWTGTADLDPGSRGIYAPDARKLYALERLVGQSYAQDQIMGPDNTTNINNWLADWERKFTAYLMLSTHYKGMYQMVANGHEKAQERMSIIGQYVLEEVY